MMEGWKEIEFGTIASFRNGLNFNKDSHGKGVLIIGVPDFQDYFKPRYETLGEILPDGILKKEDFLEEGDILFVRSNGNKLLVGRSLFIDKTIEAVFSGFCIRARIDNKNALPIFYAYITRTKKFRALLSAASGGTNIQNLNQGILNKVKVPIPPLKTQRKIASILSAYDDLIENNLKRIKLLEEQAQQTYEEWFVRFKFPGYETAVFDEESGLPVGWEKVKLTDLYDIKYGKNLPQTKIKKQGIHKVYGASGVMGYFEEPNCNEKVVLVTSRGNGSGEVHRTYERKSFITNNSFVVKPKKGMNNFSISYSQEFLKQLDLTRYCSGSAQPQLTNAAMMNVTVKLPSKNLLSLFSDFSNNNIEVADNLRIQNQLLKEARDILLPRLMSGMIDPSASSGQVVESLGPYSYREVAEGNSEYKTNQK